MSSFTDLLQLLLGHPLFLLPWGFHDKACLVVQETGFLRVCPIHLHLLLIISVSILSCPVLLQISSFVVLSCHLVFRILLKQLLMNVWILLIIPLVVRQVSAPYSNIDFTLVLNILLTLHELYRFCSLHHFLYLPSGPQYFQGK